MTQVSKIIINLLVKAILLLALLHPAFSEAQRRSTSVNISRDGKTTISIKNSYGKNFSLEYKGDIELAEDDSDVVSISRDGYLEVKRSAFGSRRRILIEPDNSGGLIKKYWLGGSQKSFDAEGKQWLSEILLDVVRTTTLGSEQRVDRMYRKGGYYPVLKEIDIIDSDYVKARYIKLLMEKKMDEKGLLGVLKRIGKVSSDHHQADILKYNSALFLSSDALRSTFIETTGKINSDHHKAEVLKKAIADSEISDNQLKALFGIAEDINSDHHKASVLSRVLEKRSLNAENTKLLISVAQSIDSDHHKASVLKKALSGNDVTPGSYHSLLSSVDNMSSDHHIASVLGTILKEDLDSESLSHLLQQVKRNMSSDMHQASVLKKVALWQDVDGSLEAYLSALKDVNSDHHKAEVFKVLSRKSHSDDGLIAILEATTTINSDHHLADTLMAFAPEVRGKSDRVVDAYHESTNSISSDHHLGRTLRALR